MKPTICNQVRLEIDHKHLSESLSAASGAHLSECADCREFQNKQTKLRQIVASLEPVSAPPDFDFKLRARLANANANGAGSQLLASPVNVWRWRSLAVAAMLLIFAATVVMIRQTEQEQQSSLGQQANVANPDAGSKAGTGSTESSGTHQQEDPSKEELTLKPGSERVVAPSSVKKRPTVALDFSSTAAPVVSDRQSLATMPGFPLEVSQHSFTVSLDDGRGSSRTISVPAVSFGSRRVLTSGKVQTSQFAPKGDW